MIFATLNRQSAVKKIANMFFVIKNHQISQIKLLHKILNEIPFDKIDKCKTIEISSGANYQKIIEKNTI